jgi:hypothetical protein
LKSISTSSPSIFTLGSSTSELLVAEGFELRLRVFDLAVDFGQQLLIVLAFDGVGGKLLAIWLRVSPVTSTSVNISVSPAAVAALVR